MKLRTFSVLCIVLSGSVLNDCWEIKSLGATPPPWIKALRARYPQKQKCPEQTVIPAKTGPSALEVSHLIQLYEININASLTLTKSDKALLVTWAEEHQVETVSITAKYRLQMTKHKEHNFRDNHDDKKWTLCLDFYANEIEKIEELYYDGEKLCLKTANEAGKEKRHAIKQIEREIKEWRKSYKYLLNLCDTSHEKDREGARACLVDYVEKDDYISALQRLMQLKLEAIVELHLELKGASENLDECLRVTLTTYVDKVRSIMESLRRCYNAKKRK